MGEPDLRTTAGKLADLQRRTEDARPGGGVQTIMDCLELLLDDGSFRALGVHAGAHDATTGFGTVDDRPVAVYSLVGPASGSPIGSIGEIIDRALEVGCPVIGLYADGAAASSPDVSPGSYGELFRRQVHASGVIPQLSLIMGEVSGGLVHAPALADFVIMVGPASRLLVNQPDMITTVTGDEFTAEELGGGRVCVEAGTAHHLAGDEDAATGYVRELLSHLPQNNLDDPPTYAGSGELEPTDEDHDLDTVMPDSRTQPYDVREVINRVLDDDLLEVQKGFAANIVVGFGRVDGRSVGVVANQPERLAGHLDIHACAKAARFVRTCDAFNLPLITVVDVPGFLPTAEQEWNGLGRRSAALVYAYAEATVPLVTVITGKAYGTAAHAMGSKQLGADLTVAWPTAQIAAMGPQAAARALSRDRPSDTEDRDTEDRDTRRAELIAEYEDELASPSRAAERGEVDAVIMPHQTRTEIIKALRLLHTKRATLPPKKHGNIPL